MSFPKKLIAFIAILAVMPAAFAATRTTANTTARPSVVGAASARMPTMSIYTQLGTTSTGGNNSGGNAIAIADQECIEAYTSCAKGADVCGPNFEECTNKTLFFAKKANCASVLFQCNASGITALFGTSNQTLFANKNSAGEYLYPTNGSVLGQMIEAAGISNRYTTSNCVKRYSTCLQKSDVCGPDFELCTSDTEFKKQKLFCESTLARCQDEGKMELFGSTNTSANPTVLSRIGIMISEGAALAAVNSVSTCYKVIDQCILNACAQNPYKCKEGSDRVKLCAAADIVTSETGDPYCKKDTDTIAGMPVNNSDIAGFIQKECFDTIGANKFCYATFLSGGAMPTNAQLQKEDNKDEIFSEAYSSRMNTSMKSKIDDLITRFDKTTRNRCSDTIVSCAMRSCGGGNGAVCYATAFNLKTKVAAQPDTGGPLVLANTIQGVMNPSTLADIKHGCEAVVNNDTACKYAGATFQSTGTLLFETDSLFDKLFTAPELTVTNPNPDPVGAVARLNAELSNSYNQAALDKMKKQCQTVASGCIRAMCGPEFTSCYRNRTDVFSTITNTGAATAAFDRSMNKVGGVLDYTIVVGLCMNTVRSNSSCETHITAEQARRTANSAYTNNSWGAQSTVRGGWLDAGGASVGSVTTTDVQEVDANGSNLCYNAQNETGPCGSGYQSGGTYITYDDENPVMVSYSDFSFKEGVNTIFRDLVRDIEVEAQAVYNAKITAEQNMCLASNSGGIMGARDSGSTYMWAKLRSTRKVPANYTVSGLNENQFTESNELYGSFCRARITIQSDDSYIQKKIAEARSSRDNWATAYFAVGDPIVCGSWIPNKVLEEISNNVGKEAKDESKRGFTRTNTWATIGGMVAGGVGGGFLTNAIQKGGIGGLLGTTNKTDAVATYVSQCENYADLYKSTGLKEYGDSAVTVAQKIGGMDGTELDGIQAGITRASESDATTQIKDGAKKSMDTLKILCKNASTGGVGTNRTKANLIGAGTGVLLGGLAGNFISRDIQNASADKAEAAAKQAWLDEVGSHINCYIGNEEVGMFGDIIPLELN